ncbi:MAG: GNAT family N-acetyltransferase [Saprospiraceae bacterium]|nr:GNAT family N-acetyltransferase [Saprospiraceae bacterium]
MFPMPTYYCFGLYHENKLIGLSSSWITIRFYSGKQLEVDNVVIDKIYQSKGLGKFSLNISNNGQKKMNVKLSNLIPMCGTFVLINFTTITHTVF